MTEETRHEIKKIVDETLIAAIKEANARSSKSITNVLLTIIQVVLVPLIGWLLWNSVEIQKDIVLLRVQVAQANEHLVEHMASSDDARAASVILHHNQSLPNCGACHTISQIRPTKNSLSRQRKIITKEDIEREKDVILVPHPEPDGDEAPVEKRDNNEIK